MIAWLRIHAQSSRHSRFCEMETTAHRPQSTLCTEIDRATLTHTECIVLGVYENRRPHGPKIEVAELLPLPRVVGRRRGIEGGKHLIHQLDRPTGKQQTLSQVLLSGVHAAIHTPHSPPIGLTKTGHAHTPTITDGDKSTSPKSTGYSLSSLCLADRQTDRQIDRQTDRQTEYSRSSLCLACQIKKKNCPMFQ
jgi:hypothetical protein